MSQKMHKRQERKLRKIAEKETDKLRARACDLINAIREDWSWLEKLGLCLWLLFGNKKWEER